MQEITAPDETVDAYREWLEAQSWTFAKTYADKAPHEYIVRDHDEVDEVMYSSFTTFIDEFGYQELYKGTVYTCLDIDDHKYWYIGKILNRRSYSGYDIIQELIDLNEDPADYVNVEHHVRGMRYGAAKRQPAPND